MDRIYIVPMEIVAGPIGDVRYPKYFPSLPYKWGCLDYGSEDICIGAVRGITQVDHDALALNTDVIALPEILDNFMTAGQTTAARNFYDTLNIPSGWINTSRTVREVVKITAGLFQFNQRWRGLSAGRQSSPFKEGMNLNTQYRNMSELNKGRVVVTMDSMQVDTSTLTGTSTIRDAMQLFAIEISLRPLVIGGISF